MLGEIAMGALTLLASVLGYFAGRLAGRYDCQQERIARQAATSRARGLERQLDAARRGAEAARALGDDRTEEALERVIQHLTRRDN